MAIAFATCRWLLMVVYMNDAKAICVESPIFLRSYFCHIGVYENSVVELLCARFADKCLFNIHPLINHDLVVSVHSNGLNFMHFTAKGCLYIDWWGVSPEKK